MKFGSWVDLFGVFVGGLLISHSFSGDGTVNILELVGGMILLIGSALLLNGTVRDLHRQIEEREGRNAEAW